MSEVEESVEPIKVIDNKSLGESQAQMKWAGKRVWNERSSYANKVNKILWLVVGGLIVAVIFLARSNQGLAARQQFIPYVVKVDGRGTVNAELLQAPTSSNWPFNKPAFTELEVKNWIENWRAVPTDPIVQRKHIDYVWYRVSDNGNVQKQIQQWYEDNKPKERAKKEEIDVEANASAESPNTWHAYWQERATSVSDDTKQVTHWQCKLMVGYVPPNPKDTDVSERLKRNATGFYVTRVSDIKQVAGDDNDK